MHAAGGVSERPGTWVIVSGAGSALWGQPGHFLDLPLCMSGHSSEGALSDRPRALRLWLQTPTRPRLRRVAIATTPVAAVDRPVLITPQGFRVEGLGAAGLVALLRVLA